MRILPIIVQFGFGGLMGLVGIWCGLRSGYLDLTLPANRRLLAVLVGGYFALLILVSLFTFVTPMMGEDGTP